MTSNAILAKRIAELERMLSNVNIVSNQLLEENKNLLLELSAQKNLLDSSILSEATAKQYAEEIDKQNKELAAQVEALQSRISAAERVETIFSEAPELSFVECKKLFPEEIRELRAEAGRAGFVEGVRQEMLDKFGLFYLETQDRANQYAAKVRRGEVE